MITKGNLLKAGYIPMKQYNTISKAFIFSLILLNISCSSYIYKTVYPTLEDGKYDSEFPYRNSSKQLQEIGNTIQRVNTVAFYNSYIFPESSKVKYSDLTGDIIKTKAIEKGNFNKIISGTATVIYYRDNLIGMLTCSHVVDLPDTILSFYGGDLNKSNALESISIKDKETIYAAGFPEGGELNLVVSDKNLDIAFLSQKFSYTPVFKYTVFNYPIGEAKNLEWGTFVYLFGYPLNYKMITDAIVSSPNNDDNGSFILNAVINEGFSGGIVMAIKDGVPNFELVGMVKSMPEEDVYNVQPEVKDNINYNPLVPYKGKLFVKKREKLKYGITKVVPIDAILKFFKDNNRALNNAGVSLDYLFH